MTDTTTGWAGPQQNRWVTLFKLGGVVVSSLLLLRLTVDIVMAFFNGAPWWPLVPAALLGYLSADLLSGAAHWFCDTFFDENTPIIGDVLIRPFRDHHIHPQRITQYRFVEQDTTNFLIMIPLLAAALQHDLSGNDLLPALSWSIFVGGLALGSYGTNVFHKWAHAQRVPKGVRWLQRYQLILAPDRHHTHHADHSRSFCVTSGWMNAPLDAIGFFSRLEAAARRLKGLTPHR